MSVHNVDPDWTTIVTSAVTVLGLLVIGVAMAAWLRRWKGVDAAIAGMPLLLVGSWAVIIEVLSITGGISPLALGAVLGASVVVSLSLLPLWWPGLRLLGDDLRRAWNALLSVLRAPAWWRWPLRLAVALALMTVIASLVAALVNPPNNPDSLAYHLPRVMWWLQGGQVGSYSASDPRQLAFPPLNSYLLLIVMGISGSDLAVNLVQWGAWLLSVVAVILIGRRAGCGRVSLVVAAVLAVTIPTGITVATTTKADWLAALWPVLAVSIVMSRSQGRLTLRFAALLLGVAAALAAATKPTSALTVALVVAWAIWWEIRPLAGNPEVRTARPARALGGAVMAAAGAVGAVAGFVPQALRTAQIYGNATGPDLDIVVAHPTAAIAWANTLRTLLNNIGVPPPLSDWINPRLPELLPLIGVPWRDDAALHYEATLQLLIGRNEDFATNPIHLLLGLIACMIVLFWRQATSRLRVLAGVILLSFLLLASIIQWNPWTSRFMLSVLILAALPLGWLLARWLEAGCRRVTWGSALAATVTVIAAVYGLAIAVAQEYRPLIGEGSILTTSRLDQYFAVNDRPGTPGDMQERVLDQVERLRVLPEGSSIGLLKVGPQEYLVWRLLNPDGRYRFVNLEGPEGLVGIDPGTLDGLVCIDDCPSGTG